MISKQRAFAIVFIGGFFPILVDRALDGSWPGFGLLGWLVLVGGLVVIALAFYLTETIRESKKNH